ncbi:MAG TPA: hypothetical protein VGH50_17840 [Candidatus Binatia bacterium]|jgi:hypothetical protein
MRILDSSARLGLSHAAALRAIGQDLTAMSLVSLEIRFENGVYFAVGARMGGAAPAKPMPSFARRYTAADLELLDRVGKSRQGRVATPDAGGLSEQLRIIGRLVDEEHGRFVNLVKQERKVVFEYLDRSGALRREELYGLGMYHTQQTAVAARTGNDIWTDSKG